MDAAMLGVLRATDRLPAAGWRTYGSLFVTLVLASAAALALGLLSSAAVSEPAQATMTLPMLCFPQVLFSGAILPVPIMATVGRLLSYPMSNRWTFEALGRGVDLNSLWAEGGDITARTAATRVLRRHVHPTGTARLGNSGRLRFGKSSQILYAN
jgi:hypothetical protein